MTRLLPLPLLLLSSALCASDLLHVPLLVRHWPESHFAAGALVGLGMQYAMRHEDIHPVGKFILATLTAGAVGMVKEAFIDKHPRAKEIPPWILGSACVSLAWEIKW